MDYSNFSADDLATDDYFISWCLEPNKVNIHFWEQWIREHPHQMEVISQAKKIVLSLKEAQGNDKNILLEKDIWENITKEIAQEKPIKVQHQLVSSRTRTILYISALAASVFLGIFLFNHFGESQENELAEKIEWIIKENKSNEIKKIVLPDRSVISVEPFSTIKYPSKFNKRKREVFLEGEAFFDIERDTANPFFVYAKQTITRVLGTSFFISAFEGQETIEVDVKTGKVAVYAKVKTDQPSTEELTIQADQVIHFPKPNKRLILTPNQRAVFHPKKEQLIKSISEVPKFILKPQDISTKEFINAPISKIFQTLEEAYGIKINTKKEIHSCSLSTKLKDESLFVKLEMICTALDFSFEDRNGEIYIEGSGCK